MGAGLPRPMRSRLRRPTPLVELAAIAVAMEAALLAGWLRPLALWQHSHNPPDGAPVVTILGRTVEGALRFALPAGLLCALYLLALLCVRRTDGRPVTLVALSTSAVFALSLVPAFPGGTQDIFHNIADGRLLWLHGLNPTTVPPSAFPEDAFYRHLFGYADLTSAYGPLWYLLDGLPVALAGDGFVANVVAQKLLMALILTATVTLTAVAAPRFGVRPAAAAVVAGWNPLLLWEFAVNGHNDALMVLFLAAAGVAAARRAWLWVLPLLALSALIKFTTLLVGPVALLWMWRRPDIPRRAIVGGFLLAVVMCLAAYLPFWAGRQTLAFLDRPGMTFILSPAALLNGLLIGPLGAETAQRGSYAITGLLFALGAGIVLLRMQGDHRDLAAGAFDVLFAYLVLASWWFWPWYLSWMAPMAAWLAGGRRGWTFALITCASLFTYLYWWDDPAERSRRWYAWYALITAGVFVVPATLRLWPIGPARRPSA